MKAPTTPDERLRCRFYQPGSAEPGRVVLEQLEPPTYRLIEAFEYVDHLGVTYTVPVDVDAPSNTTDLASIPPFLTWLVPRDGRHTPAAILHDALIGGSQGTHYLTSTGDQVSDEHADYVFREAMKALGVAWLRRWLMWSAVALRTVNYDQAGGQPRLKKVSVAITGLATLAIGVLAGFMALDVPDLGDVDLPWLGDRPWYSEIGRALVQIVVGAVGFAALLGLIYRRRRILGAGLLGGLAVGFFGLPMIASLVGATGYLLLERTITLVRR